MTINGNMNFKSVKNTISKNLSKSSIGNYLLYQFKAISGRTPVVDYLFPDMISIEIASICNLSCIHCPPHNEFYKNRQRKYGVIKMELFEKLMDEIDNQGIRHIALHKDGEPLLHPQIVNILDRVKKNHNHRVYLTSNAHRLTVEIGIAILRNRIDIINFSIGASSPEFYEKVRGKGFNLVIENIQNFLRLVSQSEYKPRIMVQIIDLPEYSEMKDEISRFKKYWKDQEVEIIIYEKLTWGVLDSVPVKLKRYPCLSLWENVFINSDGKVSACCMDWDQSLLTGDIQNQTLEEIWNGGEQKRLRKTHIEKKEADIPLCKTCNYWSTVPRLSKYKI
jgi:radical SAM protein with 4Fe4S-binding SPASM domain